MAKEVAGLIKLQIKGQVMMHADTIYLHLFTIQDKSFLCIEAESTDAGRSIYNKF